MDQLLFLAWQDLKKGEYSRALKKFQKLVYDKTGPANPQIYLGLAWCYNGVSRPDQAVIAALKALELDSNLVDSHVILASAYWQLHRFDEGRKAIQKAFELDPNSAHAHQTSGLLLLDEKRFQEAVDHFKIAIATEPSNSSYHINLAIAYQKMGHHIAAVKEYKRALECSHSFVTTSNVILSYVGHYRWLFAIFLLSIFVVRSIYTLPLMLIAACYIVLNAWFYLRHGEHLKSIGSTILLFILIVFYVYHLLYGL